MRPLSWLRLNFYQLAMQSFHCVKCEVFPQIEGGWGERAGDLFEGMGSNFILKSKLTSEILNDKKCLGLPKRGRLGQFANLRGEGGLGPGTKEG